MPTPITDFGTLSPDMKADFCGMLVLEAVLTPTAAPTLADDGEAFANHNVLVANGTIFGGAGGDVVVFAVWIYRAKIGKWFQEMTIGDITLTIGGTASFDRRVPCVFADRVYIQVVTVNNTGDLYGSAAAYGWSDRV